MLSRGLALWCVCLLEGCIAKAPFSSLFLKRAFSWVYGTTVACHGTTAGAVHGTTATSTTVNFYCRWKSGTTARVRYYRDDPWYYRTVASAWGLRTDRGSSNSPIPIQLFFPTPSLSLLPKNGAGDPRRISVFGRSPRIPSGGIIPHHFLLPWNKVSPQIPLSLVRSFVSRFWGDACCSCDFRPNLCKSRM